MKKEIEACLGFEISEEQFSRSADRAGKKLTSIIERFGNGDGERQKPYYLAQLISEDVRAEIFSAATITAALNELNMEKEHSALSRSALRD